MNSKDISPLNQEKIISDLNEIEYRLSLCSIQFFSHTDTDKVSRISFKISDRLCVIFHWLVFVFLYLTISHTFNR